MLTRAIATLALALLLGGCQPAGESVGRTRSADRAGSTGSAASPTVPAAPSRQESQRAGAPTSAGVVRRDLAADERRGGHTLARHVGKSDGDLRDRLARERISAASTYTDRDAAERTVGAAIEASASRIRSWVAREGPRPNLALQFKNRSSTPIGKTLSRGSRAPKPAHDAVVVLRWDARRGSYYVLTSYPEARP